MRDDISGPRQHTVRYCGETIVSFAQNAEDVLIFRAFGGKRSGTFIDVGAGHPISDNVTWWLYTLGWRGVNVEPNPVIFEELKKYRPADICLNKCISAAPSGTTMAFFRVEQNAVGHGWGLSSCDPASVALAESLGFASEKIEVHSTTLGAIASEHQLTNVDLVKIDVEGFEREVLASADWQTFRPKLLCIEAVRPNSAAPSFGDWEDILVDAGYVFAAFDGVNAYYCQSADEFLRGQLSAPVCINDRYRRAEQHDFTSIPVPN